MTKLLGVGLSLVFAVSPLIARAADGPLTLDVWPGKAPGETAEVGPEKFQDSKPNENPPITRLTNVSKPTLTFYRPAKDADTGASIIICPGGGYGILAMNLEGEEVAAWLNSIGVSGIVLKYRVPKRADDAKHLLPLMDAQRAVSLVRSKATELGIDPKRIGILGFSAGGHLAAHTATNFDQRAYDPIDDGDKISCRPDFAVLVYPAYLVPDKAEKGDDLSPEIRVSPKTPPCFFVHASDDRIRSAGSAAMYLALRRAGVPAELHIYSSGGHGFGLRPTTRPVCQWPQRCEEWMRSQNLIPAKTDR